MHKLSTAPENEQFVRSFQTMRGGREPFLASQAACTRCDVCSCHMCCIMTPANSPLGRLSLGAAGHSNCRRVADNVNVWLLAVALSPQKKKRQPHATPPAILPCLPADDGLFEGSAPLTRHTGWCSISRLLIVVACGPGIRGRLPFCSRFVSKNKVLPRSVLPLFELEPHSTQLQFTSLAGSSPTSHRGQHSIACVMALLDGRLWITENTKPLYSRQNQQFCTPTATRYIKSNTGKRG